MDSKTTFVKHTCRAGRGPAFGRLAPEGECKRCDELRAGAQPRQAHPSLQAAASRRADDEQHRREIADHFRSSKHRSGGCGAVCTFGDW